MQRAYLFSCWTTLGARNVKNFTLRGQMPSDDSKVRPVGDWPKTGCLETGAYGCCPEQCRTTIDIRSCTSNGFATTTAAPA